MSHSHGRMDRKGNYAVTVTVNTPFKSDNLSFNIVLLSIKPHLFRAYLACSGYIRHIYSYITTADTRESHGRAIRSQAAIVETTRVPEHQGRSGSRCTFLEQRFFRLSRSGSGQVRNASSGPRRRDVCHRSRTTIWFFTRSLLSCTGGVGPRWPSRPCSAAKRPQACAQNHRRGNLVHGPGQEQGSGPAGSGTRQAGPRTIRTVDSSAKYREGLEQGSKKGAGNAGVNHDGDPDGVWERRYEIMRHAATATHDRPWGLSVMILQGVAAWMCACPQASQTDRGSALAEPSGPSSSSTLTHPPNEVASVLTDMLLSSYLNQAI